MNDPLNDNDNKNSNCNDRKNDSNNDDDDDDSKFTIIDCESFVSSWNGDIKSPGYPRFNSMLICTWYISVSEANVIQVNFNVKVIQLLVTTSVLLVV